jgi:hypothetical protein
MVDMGNIRDRISGYVFFTLLVLALLLGFAFLVDTIQSLIYVKNLNFEELLTLVVAEVPAAIILRYILGLSESKEDKQKDREELAKAIGEAVHQAFEEERKNRKAD